MARPTRLHMAAVIVAATVGIMALALLQVALPIVLGLWGLASVMLLDLAVAVVYHHRREVHERRRQAAFGHLSVHRAPPDPRRALAPVDASEKEMTASALFVAVLLIVCIMGELVEGAAFAQSLNVPLYVVGATITLLGLVLIGAYFQEYTPRYWRPDLDDTTEDH